MLRDKQHFLQSSDWEAFQLSLGRTTLRNSGDGWQYLAIVESSKQLRRLYCPYGPTVESVEALAAALASLKQEAALNQADVIRCQPIGILLSEAEQRSLGLRPIDYSQPTKTWQLDITPSLDELYTDMKQTTRNICRNYQKKGLRYRTSQDPADIRELLRLLKGVAQHNAITFHNDHYFQKQADLFLPRESGTLHFIDYEGTVIAAALSYQTTNTMYYAHAAADFEHRKLAASTALLGEIIRTAKQNGQRIVDFYGIAPTDDPAHPYAGFTRFKQSFGGYAVQYNPTLELPLSPLRYQLYQFTRKLYRHLR